MTANPGALAHALVQDYGVANIRDLVVCLVEEIGGIVITGPADQLTEELRFESGKVVVTSDREPMVVVRPE